MSDSELIAWCEDHGFPIKLAALLSVWSPDLDELEEWDISQEETEDNVFHVNGDSYIVLDALEFDDAEEAAREDIIDYLSDDIPESVLPFIDWDAYFRKHELEINDVLFEGDSVKFGNEWYYYGTV